MDDPLQPLRERIDAIDERILDLLNQRAAVVQEVGQLKKQADSACYYVPRRERAIYERLVKESKGAFPKEAIPLVFREIISACRSLEARLRIAFFGSPGSFTHAAAIKKFGKSASFIPAEHISEVFRAVEKGECHYGVVPIRNSTHGVVVETIDNFQKSDLKIYAETQLDVHHQFLSKSQPREITRIYTHGQAFGQCREWLERHFHNAEFVEVANTAQGAERAAGEPGTAAIAAELAAEIYNLPILFPNIEDRAHNTTRFVVIGFGSEPPTGRDKTSMIVQIRNQPGALLTALEPFRRHGINLTHIDSRPTKNERWEYLFFIEFQGHTEEEQVIRALHDLDEVCLHTKSLGSYPEEGYTKSAPASVETRISDEQQVSD
jgi:chorismate mutase/prephenate dehydratase